MANLGRYEILRELGRGGMGVVWHARDTSLSREVALKVIKPDLVSPEYLRRFEIEAKATAGLNHPNIVTLYDRGEIDGHCFIAMAYVEGRTLEKILEQHGTLPPDDTLQILRQAAKALDYTHEKNVFHRDIKPANLMIRPDGHLVVMDFGIAKAMSLDSHNSSRLFGSPRYMAPEQLRFERPTRYLDQWSLAVMAYQMFSGQLPFADSGEGPFFAILNEEPVSLDAVVPSIPKPASQVIAKALSKNPSDRYANCSAFVEALALGLRPGYEETAVIGKESLPVPQPLTQPLTQPKSQPSNSKWIAGAVILLAAAVLAAGIWAIKGSKPQGPAGGDIQAADTVPTGPGAEPFRNPRDGAVYVRVPRGTFRFGCSIGDTECNDVHRNTEGTSAGIQG